MLSGAGFAILFASVNCVGLDLFLVSSVHPWSREAYTPPLLTTGFFVQCQSTEQTYANQDGRSSIMKCS